MFPDSEFALLLLVSSALSKSVNSIGQMPGITKLASEYSKDGLNVLLFPTDQVRLSLDRLRRLFYVYS